MPVQKIAVIGISGSGKSSMSRILSEKTGLPVFHMDAIFWRGNWDPVPEEECMAAHSKLLNEQDRWIIEGYIDESMVERLQRADHIVYLDFPGYVCAVQVLKRILKHRNESRPELPKESLERFSWRFFTTVLFAKERPIIEAALKGIHASKVTRLYSRDDIPKLRL